MITGIDQVTTVFTDLQTQATVIQEVLRSTTLDSTTAGNIQVSLQEILDEARTLMTNLANLDELTLGSALDGKRTVELWAWRRRTRFELVLFVGEIQALADLTAEFIQGFDERVVVVIEGDTLQGIAARELGDWQEWPRIVDRNPGLTAISLIPGLTLTIPSRT